MAEIDPNNPATVIVKTFSLVVDGRDDVSLDVTKSNEELEKECITMKEGSEYKIKIDFYVQRQIVPGLRYHHLVVRTTSGGGPDVKSDKLSEMMGSYGPKSEIISFTSSVQEAPKGMIRRGRYKISSKVLDDDKNVIAEWTWYMDVTKDW